MRGGIEACRKPVVWEKTRTLESVFAGVSETVIEPVIPLCTLQTNV